MPQAILKEASPFVHTEAHEQLHTIERLARIPAMPTTWLSKGLAELGVRSRVMGTNEVAAQKFLDALSAVDRSDAGAAREADSEGWEGWVRWLPGRQGGAADHDIDAPVTHTSATEGEESGAEGLDRFRELYMQMLTEGAASELRQLHQARSVGVV